MELWHVKIDRCKGCELCLQFCPKNALGMSSWRNVAGYHAAILSDPDACNGCALCAEMCPETAITIYRKAKVSRTTAKAQKEQQSVRDTTTSQGK